MGPFYEQVSRQFSLFAISAKFFFHRNFLLNNYVFVGHCAAVVCGWSCPTVRNAPAPGARHHPGVVDHAMTTAGGARPLGVAGNHTLSSPSPDYYFSSGLW